MWDPCCEFGKICLAGGGFGGNSWPMSTGNIVVVGSLNSDLVASVNRFPDAGETVMGTGFQMNPGGKGGNQAVAAARLGGAVAMIGAVGDDAFGNAQLASLQREGIDVNGVERIRDQPTGTALIEVDQGGENRIVVVPGANGKLNPDHILKHKGLIEAASVVLVQLEIPLDTVSVVVDLAWNTEAPMVLDPAPAVTLSDRLLEEIDFLTPNLGELGVLSGKAFNDADPLELISEGARELLGKGMSNIIVKLGARGALWVNEHQSHHWPARKVDVVDSTAAGDCFNAAFAVALCEGRSVKDAGEFAVNAAALSVTQSGAQQSMPTRADVDALIAI